MNTCLAPKALLFSTALGLLLLPGTQALAQTAAQKADAGAATLDEIVVTAQKRQESELVVPMGLTALSGEQLAKQQAFRLQDFVGKVPGLNVSETTGSQLVIRGVASSSGSINAPVATYIDDTPLVGVGAFSGGYANTPDLDTFDISRVEVLKGPQGTLYGANALGGLFKYVTNAPDPSAFAAKVQAGASSVAHGGEGYDLHGMINAPLADNLALRLVGYDNEYPGFIRDPSRGLKNINDMRTYGGRASLRWDPTSDLEIRLNALYQERKWSGISFEDADAGTLAPTFCSLCQVRDVDQPGFSELKYYNVTVRWDMGAAELLSSTTYDKFQFRQDLDLTPLYGPIADSILGAPPGTYGAWSSNHYRGEDVVHETRLSSHEGGRWDWQAGIYYTSKRTNDDQPVLAIDRANKTILQNIVFDETFLPATYREFAAFGNIKYKITPTLDVALGARASQNSQTFQQISPLAATPPSSQSESVFTYSADLRWRYTVDSMLYARVASGFAPGGPNAAPFNSPIPPTYGSSKTTNYEVGYKSKLLDNRLTAELSAFLIDWQDIQLLAPFQGYTSLANGGAAVSKGVEWAFNYAPLSGLTLSFNGAYTDAHLTEDTPVTVGGLKGDRLPITPRWQLAAGAEYRRPVFGDYSGYAGVDWRYASSRWAEFEPSQPRQKMPSYSIVDLRAGIESDRYSMGVFVRNVGDTVAINYALDATMGYGQQKAFVSQPRTIGVEFAANY